jgi:hypothetical protein
MQGDAEARLLAPEGAAPGGVRGAGAGSERRDDVSDCTVSSCAKCGFLAAEGHDCPADWPDPRETCARLRQAGSALADRYEATIDRIENLLGALALPLPDRVHVQGIRALLPEIRDAARAALSAWEEARR